MQAEQEEKSFKLAPDPGIKIVKAPVKADPRSKRINPVLPNFNSCMLFTGGPGSGKSTLIHNLLTQKKGGSYRGEFDHIFIFSPSNTLKFPGVPSECCINTLDFDFIAELLEDDELQGKNVLFVLDDVVQEMKANSKELLKIFYNRRHVFNRHKNQEKPKTIPNDIVQDILQCDIRGEPIPQNIDEDTDDEDDTGSLTIMMTTQKYNAIPLKFRTVADAVFVFKPDIAEAKILSKELLCKYLTDQSPNGHFKLMNFVFDKPHNFIYINKATDKIHKNLRRITANL